MYFMCFALPEVTEALLRTRSALLSKNPRARAQINESRHIPPPVNNKHSLLSITHIHCTF